MCITDNVPANVTERDDGWKAFRIQGILDFSLIGILSRIAGILAENEIGIFAVSTFNTDYILTKKAVSYTHLSTPIPTGVTAPRPVITKFFILYKTSPNHANYLYFITDTVKSHL